MVHLKEKKKNPGEEPNSFYALKNDNWLMGGVLRPFQLELPMPLSTSVWGRNSILRSHVTLTVSDVCVLALVQRLNSTDSVKLTNSLRVTQPLREELGAELGHSNWAYVQCLSQAVEKKKASKNLISIKKFLLRNNHKKKNRNACLESEQLGLLYYLLVESRICLHDTNLRH